MANLPKLDIAQLKALNSPLRLEILTNLRTDGAGTAAEIGERLGKDELLLYYHLKRLLAVGLIFASGAKATATKPETVYTARPPGIADDLDLSDPETKKQMQKNVATILKAASREYSNASEHRDELRNRVRELAEWLAEHSTPGEPQYSLTLTVSPLRGQISDSG